MVSLTDPERRRKMQAEEVGGGDKEVVREYFNSTGFERWRKIYGETDEVNRVQKDIRIGHTKTVENAMLMLTEEGSLAGVTVCDAGCGTGSLSIPLAKEGAIVSARDISAAMVAEAEMKAKQQLPAENLPRFEVNDLESLSGKYNTVVCLDVLIHYTQNKADGMIAHLVSREESGSEFCTKDILQRLSGDLMSQKKHTHEFGKPPGGAVPSYKQRFPGSQQLSCIAEDKYESSTHLNITFQLIWVRLNHIQSVQLKEILIITGSEGL